MGQIHYRSEIDGLRAVAVVPVLLFHAGFTAFSGGYVGVDVFFVISGFLITKTLLVEINRNQFSVKKFYERRARRILPAQFFVVLLSIFPAWYLMSPNKLKDFGQTLIALTFFISNILFWKKTEYFETSVDIKPLIHMWSLSVEEQFYFIFPLMLTVFPVGKKKTLILFIILGAVSLTFAQWLVGHAASAAFFLSPTRAWELLTGAAVARMTSLPIESVSHPADASKLFHLNKSPALNNFASLIGMCMILVPCVVFTARTPVPGFYATLPVFGTALVLLFAVKGSWVNQILSTRPFVGIGLVSYSTYLWHQPLFAFLRLASLEQPSPFAFVAAGSASIGLGFLTWKYVETPFRSVNRYSSRQIWLFSFVLSAGLLAIGATLQITKGLESFSRPSLIKVIAALDSENADLRACEAGSTKELPPDKGCVRGDLRRTPTIALIGDSHAGAIFAQAGTEFGKLNVSIKLFTYLGCPPVQNLAIDHAVKSNRCKQYNDDVLNYLAHSPEISTVIIASRWSLYLDGARFTNKEGGDEKGDPNPAVPSRSNWKGTEDERRRDVASAYTTAVELLLKLGKKVILVYPVPECGWDVPTYLTKLIQVFKTPLTPRSGSTSLSIYRERNAASFAALDAITPSARLRRIYPHRIFCDTLVKGRCVVQIGGIPLYYDDNHLTNDGAMYIVRDIIDAYQSLLIE